MLERTEKMTDNEIIKALEQWIKNYDGSFVNFKTLANAHDLITRQQAEIEALIAGQETLQKYIAQQQARIDEFMKATEVYTPTLEDYNKFNKKFKSEAYKECIEKVKKEISEALKSNYKARAEREQKIPIYTETEFLSYCSGKIDCLRGIDDFLDNLIKEIVGENNG